METRHVLIVEERGHVSTRLRTIVQWAGLRAVVSYSGQMASSITRMVEPDLVLLSDQLSAPGVSEIARAIKEDPATADIPVMILLNGARTGDALSRIYPIEACMPIYSDDRELVHMVQLLARRARRAAGKKLGSLEGNLGGELFPEVLQFLFVSGKNGRVVMSQEGIRIGNIYFEGGIVLHAELGRERGTAAFNQACFLKEGSFRFEPNLKAPETTMHENGVELLLEAARQQDVLKRDGKAESLETPPARNEQPLRAVCNDLRRNSPRRFRPSSASGNGGRVPMARHSWKPSPHRSRDVLKAVLLIMLLVTGIYGVFSVGKALIAVTPTAPEPIPEPPTVELETKNVARGVPSEPGEANNNLGLHLEPLASERLSTRHQTSSREPDTIKQLGVPLLSSDRALEIAPDISPRNGTPIDRELPFVDPVKLSGAYASYPPEARRKRLEGTVEVQIEVDEEGNVAKVQVLRSAGSILDTAVVTAVRTWKYQPATRGGVPTRAFVTYRHSFRGR